MLNGVYQMLNGDHQLFTQAPYSPGKRGLGGLWCHAASGTKLR